MTIRMKIFLTALALLAVAFFPHGVHAVLPLGFIGFGGMILDAQMLLSDAQALTATALSTNTFDAVIAGNNLSTGEKLGICFTVDVAADFTTGDETYQFQVIQSANADLSAQDVLVETTVAYLTATKLAKGYRLVLPIPPELVTKRYLGARYVLAGTTPLLTVTAEILPMSFMQADHVYPKNFTISS